MRQPPLPRAAFPGRRSLPTRALVAQRTPPRRHYATPVEYAPPPAEKDPQLGDYPQLPPISNQLRPPRGWWDTPMRRNHGEVLHEEDEALNMWSPDPPVIDPARALRQFTLVALAFAAFGYTVYHNVPESPAVPRQYPYAGLVAELGGLGENKAAVLEEEE